jgi:hypothetical protein
VLLIVLALATPAAWAQLVDPTRPPAAAVSAPAATASAVRPAAAPRLQSVRVPQGGPASALIDDRLVRVGDKLGERTVVAIDAAGVVLRNAKGTPERVPLLNPAIVKQASATPPAPAVARIEAQVQR